VDSGVRKPLFVRERKENPGTSTRGMPAAGRGKAKGRSSVIGPRPGWCEGQADIGRGDNDADPLLLSTTLTTARMSVVNSLQRFG